MAARPLTFLLLFFLSVHSNAECTCIWQGSFTEVQANADLVVSAKVIKHKGNSIDLLIDEPLRGKEYKDTIRVWMNTGDLCRPESEKFPDESQWVMALQKIKKNQPGDFNPSTPNMSTGRVGDYSLSSCGGYWLSQNDNLVTGNLAAGRWERDPEMSPVLIELITAFVQGNIDAKVLQEAATIDTELQRIRLETRMFLRAENRKSGFE